MLEFSGSLERSFAAGGLGSTPGELNLNRMERSLRYSIGKTKDIAAE